MAQVSLRLLLKRAVDAGAWVAVEEGRFEAPFPSLLEAAEGVVAAGVSLDYALTVTGKVRSRCRSISNEFVELFPEDIWKRWRRSTG